MRHAELARESAIAEVLVIENGDVLEVGAETAPHKVGRTRVGRVATFGGAPLADEVLRERAQIGRVGVVSVAVVLGADGELMARPSVTSAGVLTELDGDVLDAAAKAAERVVREMSGRTDPTIQEAARLAARRAIESEIGQRPLVQVSVTRLARPAVLTSTSPSTRS
jgi:ribonuclease J